MKNLLVFGIDTVAGANIAATLSDRYQVTGISQSVSVDIEDCQCDVATQASTDIAESLISKYQPDWVIHCGSAARSTWFEKVITPSNSSVDAVEQCDAVEQWAAATKRHQVTFSYLSSDAVFTGPWMFHEEEGDCLCPTKQSKMFRQMESAVLSKNNDAGVFRTNVFGWTPEAVGEGWIETMLEQCNEQRIQKIDNNRYATPLHASDAAEILHRAFTEKSTGTEKITGVFHLAGAERTTPLQFVRKLADQFDATYLETLSCQRTTAPMSSRPKGFGMGETSLQTKQIRKSLCVAMPMLTEGLERLYEQNLSGYREKLSMGVLCETQQRETQRRAA